MKNSYLRISMLFVAMLFTALTQIQAQSNQYLHYDCTNQNYVVLENASQYIANKPGFTMAGWFIDDYLEYGQGIMGFRGNQGFYMIELADGKIECRFQNSAGTLYEYVAPTNTVIPQVWQHFAWVFDGSNVILYVNGILKGSKPASGTFTASDIHFTIGRSILADLNFYWCGGSDEVTVWSKALTADEIQDMMANELNGDEPGLELYYKHNQGVPGGNNTSITTLISEVDSPNRDADLVNFTMDGETSNFIGDLDPGYQAIAFLPIPNKLTSDEPFQVEATATSGLPVTFTVLSGPATMDGNTVTLTGDMGEVAIEANQAGNGTYDPAEPVVQRFNVLDPMLHLPEIDIRNPLAGDVFVSTLSEIQLACVSTIDFPELFDVTWVKFRVNGQTIQAQKFWNGHFTGWWAPPAYGTYTVEVMASNNFGAVKTETMSINVVPTATNTEVIAFTDIWINPNHTEETIDAELPSFLGAYNQITGTLRVSCPDGGCGEWDRVAFVEAQDKEGNWFKIIQYITPYGVACSHAIDLTDFSSILQGKTKFRVSCGTLDNGFDYELKLNYYAGTAPYLYSSVDQIWRAIYWFGDYANLQPVEPVDYEFPENTQAATLKLVSSGHGWGSTNTGNAAEFYEATHDITVNGVKTFTQHNWVVCNPNPDACQPQNGTWYYNRAGWCPGSIAQWFDYDLTDYISSSGIELGYIFFEDYIDYCHPNHPNCVTGTTCSNCEDGFNPQLDVACNLVSFANSPIIVVGNQDAKPVSNLLSIFPNPSTGVFEISVSSTQKLSDAQITVYDNMNRAVKQMEWDGKDTQIDLTQQPKGIYFVKVNAKDWSEVRKIIVQ